jgi:peptidoglycan/xylan/chitin deacetylase (PgdA/CDA1 family)
MKRLARSITTAAVACAAMLWTAVVPAAASTARVDCARVKCIALTFDDGPGPSTGKLLDLLRQRRAKATFFVVGRQAERRPALVRRMAREGHEIGNHTYSHPRLTGLPEHEILEELTGTQEIIERITGRAPRTMRPPYGDSDERVAAVAEFAGLAQILWTGSTRDWELRDRKAIARKALSLVRRDAVILMHDTVPETVKAMPEILGALRKRGYHLVTVAEVLRGESLIAGQRYP